MAKDKLDIKHSDLGLKFGLKSLTLVKIKDCCTENFLRQSFQLKKSQNNQHCQDKSFRYLRPSLKNCQVVTSVEVTSF